MEKKLHNLQIISEEIIRLQGQVKALTLNCNESEFNAAIKFCDEQTHENKELSDYLKKYLIFKVFYPHTDALLDIGTNYLNFLRPMSRVPSFSSSKS